MPNILWSDVGHAAPVLGTPDGVGYGCLNAATLAKPHSRREADAMKRGNRGAKCRMAACVGRNNRRALRRKYSCVRGVVLCAALIASYGSVAKHLLGRMGRAEAKPIMVAV